MRSYEVTLVDGQQLTVISPHAEQAVRDSVEQRIGIECLTIILNQTRQQDKKADEQLI